MRAQLGYNRLNNNFVEKKENSLYSQLKFEQMKLAWKDVAVAILLNVLIATSNARREFGTRTGQKIKMG